MRPECPQPRRPQTHHTLTRGAASSFWIVVGALLLGTSSGCDSTIRNPVQANAHRPQDADDTHSKESAAEPLRDLLQQATLSLGETTLRPLRVRAWTHGEILADDLRLQVNGKSVIALDLESGQERWRAEAPFPLDEYDLQFADGVMYVAGYAPPSFDVKPISRHDGRITRLRLADGVWLEPLQAPLAETVEQQGLEHPIAGPQGEVCEIFLLEEGTDDTRSAGMIAFSQIWNRAGQLHGYVVTRMEFVKGENSQAETKWSKLFQYSADDQSILKQLVGGMPLRGFPGNRMQGAGDKLIVCDGGADDLFALDLATGRELWRIPRVWEYRRLYTGAGNWHVTLTRNGLYFEQIGLLSEAEFQASFPNDEDARQRYDEAKAKYDQAREQTDQHEHRITAGPVVVPAQQSGEFRIYLGISFGQALPWVHRPLEPEYLIYEITAEGEVARMANVPYPLPRDGYDLSDGQLAWEAGMRTDDETDAGRMLLLPTEEHYFDEKRVNFEYSRDHTAVPLALDGEKFVTADQTRGVTVDGFVIRLGRNAWLGQQEVQFPLVLHNLRTGTLRELLLTVPHDGAFGTPDDSFSIVSGEERRSSITSHQFFLQHAEVHDGRLVLMIDAAEQDFALEFSWADVRALHDAQ